MARKSARSNSRQTTPVSPAKPSSTATRARRHQGGNVSHDSDLGMPAGAGEQGDTIHIEASTTRSRRKARKSCPQHIWDCIDMDLAPDPLLEEEAAEHHEIEDMNVPNSGSEDDTDISETYEELEQLDRHDIVENLHLLYQDSKALLEVVGLHPTDKVNKIVHELQEPSSKAATRLRRLATRLEETREGSFGQRQIISPDLISHKIAGLGMGSLLPMGTWRPDCIIYLANLATTFQTLLSHDRSDNDIVSLLMLLHQNFPTAFTTGLDTIPSNGMSFETSFARETLELAVELETQLTISMLLNGKSQGADPSQVINSIWHKNGDGFHLLERPGLSNLQGFRQMIEARIRTIKDSSVTERGDTLDLENLQQAFAWEGFLAQFVFWIQARAAEVEEQLRSQGGVDEIRRLIELDPAAILALSNQDPEPQDQMRSPLREMTLSEARNRTAAVPIDPVLQSPFGGHRAPRDWLQEKRAQIANRQSGAGSSTLLNPSESTPTSAQLPNSSDPNMTAAYALPRASQDVASILETFNRQDAERNKENTRTAPYNRRQADATRLVLNDTQIEEAPIHGLKRLQPELDEEDANFETDARPQKPPARTKKPRGRPAKAPQISLASPSQAALDAQLSSPQHPTAEYAQDRPSSLVQRPSSRPPPSSAPAVSNDADDLIELNPMAASQPMPASQSYAMTNATAKAAAAAARVRQASLQIRPPQRRRPWSAEETTRLIELIEDYGVSWSQIMQEDAKHPQGRLLQERGQVGLKDKARNIKIDYLK